MTTMSERIIEEYELEQKARRLAVNPGDIPISYDAITNEWLTHLLCKKVPDAAVKAFHLDGTDDGTANRRRIFVDYNATGEAAGLPASIFCKAGHKLENRLLLAGLGLTEGEDAFFSKYSPLLDIETPTCLLATYDPRSFNSIIVLDDLVRQGAAFCDFGVDITRQRAEAQMALLAKLHGPFYERSASLATLAPYEDIFKRFDSWLDLEKICNEGFQLAEAVIPRRLFRRHAEIWPATLKSAAAHTQRPRTFTHDDCHLRNWYITSDGRLGLSNWQIIGQGDGLRDVVYAISTSLTIENCRALEIELLEFYLDRLRAAGGPIVNAAEAWKYYRQHLFTSLAWWTSTLAMVSIQPRRATLAIIERIATAIDDLAALSSFG